MGEPILAFIALSGSALLGFLFCASLERIRLAKLSAEKTGLLENLKKADLELLQLRAEGETRMLTIENLQKISQDFENQALEREFQLKILSAENLKFQDEIHFLIENPIEKIKEIDVIREVPVLVLREINMPESRMEKAKKLMKAFTKGYLDENGLLHEMTKEEIADKDV